MQFLSSSSVNNSQSLLVCKCLGYGKRRRPPRRQAATASAGCSTLGMLGYDGPDCETEWFYFTRVGIDPNAKSEGSWFCESCWAGEGRVLGRRLVVVVQRAVEVGTWWEGECWGLLCAPGLAGLLRVNTCTSLPEPYQVTEISLSGCQSSSRLPPVGVSELERRVVDPLLVLNVVY